MDGVNVAKVLIVYDSKTGNKERMVEAVVEGQSQSTA